MNMNAKSYLCFRKNSKNKCHLNVNGSIKPPMNSDPVLLSLLLAYQKLIAYSLPIKFYRMLNKHLISF